MANSNELAVNGGPKAVTCDPGDIFTWPIVTREDEDAVLESVAKTMHLVTVEEGWLAGGFGAEVAARVAEKAVNFLDGPIIRVGALDAPIPAARSLEDAVLPSAAKIVAAAKRALGA